MSRPHRIEPVKKSSKTLHKSLFRGLYSKERVKFGRIVARLPIVQGGIVIAPLDEFVPQAAGRGGRSVTGLHPVRGAGELLRGEAGERFAFQPPPCR